MSILHEVGKRGAKVTRSHLKTFKSLTSFQPKIHTETRTGIFGSFDVVTIALTKIIRNPAVETSIIPLETPGTSPDSALYTDDARIQSTFFPKKL